MLCKEYSVSPEMRRSLLQRPRNLSLCISKTPFFIFLWIWGGGGRDDGDGAVVLVG